MNYKHRLIGAAKTILTGDSNNIDVNLSNIAITATLKPHQVEGVSWLIRRYHLGVNVILGNNLHLSLLTRTLIRVYTSPILSFHVPYFICVMFVFHVSGDEVCSAHQGIIEMWSQVYTYILCVCLCLYHKVVFFFFNFPDMI